MDFFGLTFSDIYQYLLVAFRTGALFMMVPVFGHRAIPLILKIWLVLIFSFLVFPSTVLPDAEPPATMMALVFIIIRELGIGFLIGFAVVLLFAAVQYAGQLAAMQMGLTIANVIDPLGSGQISVISEFYYLLSILLFVLMNGHHFMIEALVRSFELVPVSGGVFSQGLGDYMITLTGMVFIVAVKLAAPVMITLFIMNAILGIIARTVPQMNVFMVGFPVSIGVGFAIIGLSLPAFKLVMEQAGHGLESQIAIIIRMLAP